MTEKASPTESLKWVKGAKNEERASTLTSVRDAKGEPITLHQARKLGQDNKPIATIRSIKPIPADWYERILKRREV